MHYERWIFEVGLLIWEVTGFRLSDIREYGWSDAYKAGSTPENAVHAFLVECNYFRQVSGGYHSNVSV